MKPSNLKLADITEFDLNLAKNDRAAAFANEIAKLALAERAQRRQNLQQKIQEGAASLFEEKVLTKLLEAQTAEKISAIRQNLPALEAEFAKRQAAPGKQSLPPDAPPKTNAGRAAEYPSELLTFLASQKPPAPPAKKAAEQVSSSGMAVPTPKQALWSVKDLAAGGALVLAFVLALWYSLASQEARPPATFNQQAAAGTTEAGSGKEISSALQTQFDDGAQQLRFGAFEQGKTQLLALIRQHPDAPQAEDAYLAIAETYRQRQNNPAEALKYYQTFLEKYPQSPRAGLAQLKMGFTHEDLEDGSSAAEMYRLILKQHGAKSRLGQLASERLAALQSPEKRD